MAFRARVAETGASLLLDAAGVGARFALTVGAPVDK